MPTTITSPTSAALSAALAASPGSVSEVVNVLNGAQLNNVTIPGTLQVTGVTTLTGGTVNGSISNAITAFATGGQTNAVALVVGMNRITVCATAGDSVLLPAATAGRNVTLVNVGAAAAAVFPNGATDVIQGIGTTTAMLLASGQSIEFRCAVAGTWSVVANSLLECASATGTLQSATLAAGAITGGGICIYTNTGTTPGTLTTRTATQMFAETPGAQVGMTYLVMIGNLSGSANTATISGGSGVTVSGTATIAQNIGRWYRVTFDSATALTMLELFACTIAA